MKYTLTDYQAKAATEVLERINQAHMVGNAGLNAAFALTAATGAGKTVIATAVVEALLDGSTELGVEGDDNLAIIWLTNDPSLNNQTRRRMISASDSLTHNRLVSIGEDGDGTRLDQAEFTRGHVYFLNVQKLYGSSSSWVKQSNSRHHTLWETFANTIQSGKTPGGTKLLVIIDEAHRGIGAPGSAKDTQTTMGRLISGDPATGQPPLPIVWGISATPERFDTVMAAAKSHTVLPAVEVDINAVRQSGLLKDSIVLDAPDESGTFDTTMLREAVKQTIDYQKAWQAHAMRENDVAVEPVLVIQVGNKPSPASLAELVGVITSEWESTSGSVFPDDAMVNVFGEHDDLLINTLKVTYMRPEDIQDSHTVRVVLAKDAITTGWDCPRAEVLFSLRTTADYTTIAQMIGRMVRTPLARRIVSDETLNTVACFLPKFNRQAVDEVIAKFSNAGDDEPPVTIVERGTKTTVRRNTGLDERVFALLESLPSETLPKLIAANAVTRLKRFSTELSKHFPDANYPTQVADAINATLDAQRLGRPAEFAALVDDLRHAELARLTYAVYGDKKAVATEARSRTVDAHNAEDAYKQAMRLIPEGAVKDYERHLYNTFVDPHGAKFDAASEWADFDSSDTQTYAAATGLLAATDSQPSVATAVERTCEGLLLTWSHATRVAVNSLNEKDRADIKAILSNSRKPTTTTPEIPAAADVTSVDTTFDRHVLVDENNLFPFKANSWEAKVLAAELDVNQPGGGALAWYRNPSQATAAALSIPYVASGVSRADALANNQSVWTSLQPDFIVIRANSQGEFTASIVDPHGTHLGDAVPKIKALAEYAVRCETLPTGEGGFTFDRIDSIAVNSAGNLAALDLTEPTVRAFVLAFEGMEAKGMFDSVYSVPYGLGSRT